MERFLGLVIKDFLRPLEALESYFLVDPNWPYSFCTESFTPCTDDFDFLEIFELGLILVGLDI